MNYLFKVDCNLTDSLAHFLVNFFPFFPPWDIHFLDFYGDTSMFFLLFLCTFILVSLLASFPQLKLLKYHRALGHYSRLFIFSFSVTSSCPVAFVFCVSVLVIHKPVSRPDCSLEQLILYLSLPMYLYFPTYTYSMSKPCHLPCMFPLCYPTLYKTPPSFP